jgi:hypothetical protein
MRQLLERYPQLLPQQQQLWRRLVAIPTTTV